MLLQRYFDVSESGDVATFKSRLIQFANDMDFGLVSASLVIESPTLVGEDAFFSVTNAAEEYMGLYSDVEDSRRDPVMKRYKRLSVPFIYDQGTYTSSDAADLWEKQAPFGYRTGIAVAIHMPDRRHFLLGVDRERDLPKDTSQLSRLMADLQLLAVHAQHAAGRLLVPSHEAQQAPSLTERELEVLKWTMAGKSAWVVSELLAISENTVNFHLRNVFRKLDVASKHQAVLKALALGIMK